MSGRFGAGSVARRQSGTVRSGPGLWKASEKPRQLCACADVPQSPLGTRPRAGGLPGGARGGCWPSLDDVSYIESRGIIVTMADWARDPADGRAGSCRPQARADLADRRRGRETARCIWRCVDGPPLVRTARLRSLGSAPWESEAPRRMGSRSLPSGPWRARFGSRRVRRERRVKPASHQIVRVESPCRPVRTCHGRSRVSWEGDGLKGGWRVHWSPRRLPAGRSAARDRDGGAVLFLGPAAWPDRWPAVSGWRGAKLAKFV